ncbi:type II toxin-antitoxin system VapC family toxin [Microcystis aeruginosa]|uniref:type II toxin-antitoxin system VapC family toxin n=1 Tax=Microcystis aeruginosa TaxID=1126 RepID=UPI0011BF4B8E|nr:hypothetical protein [Microcystis aeruginosa]
MEWLMQLQGQVVGLDTAPLIYLMEQNQAYLGLVRAFFGAVSRGEFQVVTSTLTLTEVLVHPLRSGKYLSKINYTYLTTSCLLSLASCLSSLGN